MSMVEPSLQSTAVKQTANYDSDSDYDFCFGVLTDTDTVPVLVSSSTIVHSAQY